MSSKGIQAPQKISLLLPGRGRGGGTRVTVQMANLLLNKGYTVRIIYPRPSFSLKSIVKQSYFQARGISWDFVNDFDGKVESFQSIENVHFDKGEVVMAITMTTAKYLSNISEDVIKVRYCHEGFTGFRLKTIQEAWKISMPTIFVHETFVERYESFTGEKVVGVVPNGIDFSEYYDEGHQRDGVGAVYSSVLRKRPKEMIEIFEAIGERWPSMERYIFGKDRRPKELKKEIYWRLPSIAKTRELYNRSKVWVVASHVEGFCLPLLEAMACGCAVVSTNHDTAASFINHGENGFIVPCGDGLAMLEHIEILLNDEELRRKFVERGKETVKKYTWDSAVDRMEECLKKLHAEYDARKSVDEVL